MKKKAIVLLQTIFIIASLHSQVPDGTVWGWFLIPKNNINYGWPTDLNFTKNNYSLIIELDNKDHPESLHDESIITKGSYTYYEEKGNYTITIDNTIPFIYTNDESLLDGCMILYSQHKIIIIKDNIVLFESEYCGNAAESLPFASKITQSSFLEESNNIYSGSNVDLRSLLISKSPLLPWVESIPGYGNGESVEITYSSYLRTSGFLISNGYVSYKRPDLYTQNSRIKILKIESSEGFSKAFVLNDSANFQFLDLDRTDKSFINRQDETFKFTIVDYYKGTKWEDTCLNLIIPVTQLSEGF